MQAASERLIALRALVAAAALAAATVLASPAAAAPVRMIIALHDSGFGFRNVAIRATRARLTVVNRGHRPHALAVSRRGGAAMAKTGRLEPGQRAQLSLALEPGRYRLFSPLDHDSAHGLSAPLDVIRPSPQGVGGAEMNRVFYNYGRPQ